MSIKGSLLVDLFINLDEFYYLVKAMQYLTMELKFK